MKWVPMKVQGFWVEWVETAPKRWELLGRPAVVFHARRHGWFAEVEGRLLGPFPSKEQAMRAAAAAARPRRWPWTGSARSSSFFWR